jgi:hypothetical protein
MTRYAHKAAHLSTPKYILIIGPCALMPCVSSPYSGAAEPDSEALRQPAEVLLPPKALDCLAGSDKYCVEPVLLRTPRRHAPHLIISLIILLIIFCAWEKKFFVASMARARCTHHLRAIEAVWQIPYGVATLA